MLRAAGYTWLLIAEENRRNSQLPRLAVERRLLGPSVEHVTRLVIVETSEVVLRLSQSMSPIQYLAHNDLRQNRGDIQGLRVPVTVPYAESLPHVDLSELWLLCSCGADRSISTTSSRL